MSGTLPYRGFVAWMGLTIAADLGVRIYRREQPYHIKVSEPTRQECGG